ncbi:MAG: hypothetical protein GY832_35015 [Chloroflexi bacterium]|nr:hypothetical protein [Chloroflexota bacterium]
MRLVQKCVQQRTGSLSGPLVLILCGLLVALTTLVVSCTGDVCGDIWDRSPAQLLQENQCVMLAQFDGIDTLIELGTLDYLGAESDFVLVSYSFSLVQPLRSPDENSWHLWNCERSKATYTTILGFDPGDTVLVYGSRVETSDDLFLVLSPMAPQGDLGRILQGKSPQLDWNTRAVDSTLAVAIGQSDALKELLAVIQLRGEIVLYCPEEFCLTMKDFHKGRLCYYDSLGVGHQVSSTEYLRSLIDVGSR